MSVFHVLGDLVVDGATVGGRQRRGLLAYLLARAGTTVPLERICDDLWDGNPSAGARGTVRTYLSQFRKLEPSMRVNADAAGYGVVVDRPQLDASRFEDLVAEARSCSGEKRLGLLDDALALWRGPAFAEFRGAGWADEIARPLEAARRRATTDRLELLGDLGRLDEALAGLDVATSEDPLDERLAALRALHLYRSGRVAEALRSIGAVRRALADELGVDPGPELVDLEMRMLKRDETLVEPSAGTGHPDPSPAPAAGLPAGTVTFLFTDIVGSTVLLREIGDEAYAEALTRHRDVIANAVTGRDGVVFGTEGDATFTVFTDAAAACAAAVDVVTELRREPWQPGWKVRVRTGLHTGRALVVDDDYAGSAVHIAARVSSSAHADQIVATDATVALTPGVGWRDLGIHRLKDVERPQRIHQLLDDGLPESFPPLPTARNVPNNLPEIRDACIGRAEDIEGVCSALAAGPLTTLVGPGGVGKTRLAVESARACLADHAGGVHFVALAGVSGDDGVEPTVRRVMSLPDRTDLDLGAATSAATAGETSLIVLDNCEHVLTGATTVVQALLTGCPTVRVLCTSREPLQLRGERVRRVEPLPTSTGNDRGPAEELYVARAEAATGRPVPDSDLPLVRELTRGLDGLPLAIELAAARARGLALVDVFHRLDDRFRLLRSVHRDVDDRHRTLESVIAWSHELLTPSDRALMNRLAVFGGTFSLPVAEDVCEADSLDADAVFDGMARLVDKSLVHFQSGSGESRYRMLETIRRFCLDRLDASGEREHVEARLVGWVMDLVDRLERDMRTERQDATLRAATAERDVARTALDILLAGGRFHDALRVVASVPIDVPRERVRLIDELISRVGSAHPDTAGRAHLAATNLCVEMGAIESGIAHGREAGRIYRELDDVGGTAWAAFLESFATWAAGDRQGAREVIARASSAFEQLGDATGMANAAWMHASLTDDLDTAAQRAAEAERLCRALDSPTALAHSLEVRALIGLRRHEVEGLGDWLAEALAAFADIRHEGCTAHVLEAVAAIAASEDAPPDLVAELLGAADRLREISGHSHRPWELEGHSVALEALGARLSGSDVEHAIERGREHTFDSATAAARRLLAGMP